MDVLRDSHIYLWRIGLYAVYTTCIINMQRHAPKCSLMACEQNTLISISCELAETAGAVYSCQDGSKEWYRLLAVGLDQTQKIL